MFLIGNISSEIVLLGFFFFFIMVSLVFWKAALPGMSHGGTGNIPTDRELHAVCMEHCTEIALVATKILVIIVFILHFKSIMKHKQKNMSS